MQRMQLHAASFITLSEQCEPSRPCWRETTWNHDRLLLDTLTSKQNIATEHSFL